jgi:hypothetical protein
MNFPFDDTSLLTISHKLKDEMCAKNITRDGKPVGLQLCRQLICQAMVHKPYEEVKALLAIAPALNQVASVYLLHYGAEIVLAVLNDAGQLVLQSMRDRGTGSYIELTTPELENLANHYALTLQSRVVRVYLPVILGDEWEYDGILNLAMEMGYGQREATLLDVLAEHDGTTFINGHHSHYGLNGEWQVEVQALGDEFAEDAENEDPKEHVVWQVDIEDGFELYEYYFTLNEMMHAQQVKGETNAWIISQALQNETRHHLINLYS